MAKAETLAVRMVIPEERFPLVIAEINLFLNDKTFTHQHPS